MKLKEILVNSVWYGIIPKLTAVLSLFILPLITPYLTPSDYGKMGLINSYIGIGIGVCTLGLHVHLTNSYYEYKAWFYLVWRRIYFLMFFFSILISCVLIIIFSNTFAFDVIINPVVTSVLAVIPLLLYPNQVIVNHYYPLVNKPKIQVLRNLIGGLAGIFTSFLLIRFFNYGYGGWVVGTAISSVLVFSLFIKPLWFDLKIFPKIDTNLSRIYEFLKIAIPVIPHNLGHVILSSSDRLIMSFYSVSIFNIGLYSNGYQIGEYANFLILGLFTALIPVLQSSYRANESKKMIFYFRITTILISGFVSLAGLWMKEFYLIFIRNIELQDAYPIAALICLSYIITGLYTFLSTAVMIEKNTKMILYLVFLPSIVNIILNFLLIPRFGFISAVYSTLASYWLIVLLPFVNQYFREVAIRMFGTNKLILWNILFSMLVIAISFGFKGEEIYIKILATSIVIIVCVVYYARIEKNY